MLKCSCCLTDGKFNIKKLQVKDSLLHKYNEVSCSRIVATLQYEFGLTKQKIMEYLRILEDLEQFTLDFEKD